jgi:hypothetical protein
MFMALLEYKKLTFNPVPLESSRRNCGRLQRQSEQNKVISLPRRSPFQETPTEQWNSRVGVPFRRLRRSSGIPVLLFHPLNFIILLSLFIFSVYPVLAQGNLTNAGENLGGFASGSGYDTGADIDVIIGSIIKYFLSFLGVVFLILLVYAGYLWMQARGDSEAVQKAKDTMINAVIGLAIVLGAYLLTNWIVYSLVSETLKP